jgi:hypothetical protein
MSTEPTIEQMNEAIALFEGWRFIKGDPNHKCNFCFAGDEPCTPAMDRFLKDSDMRFRCHLKYHESWDCLMPVIKKIRWMHTDLLLTAKGGVSSYIKAAGEMNRGLICCDIDKAHRGVYIFLQWYNNQSTTTNDTTTRNKDKD